MVTNNNENLTSPFWLCQYQFEFFLSLSLSRDILGNNIISSNVEDIIYHSWFVYMSIGFYFSKVDERE